MDIMPVVVMLVGMYIVHVHMMAAKVAESCKMVANRLTETCGVGLYM